MKASDWYKVSFEDIVNKGGRTLLADYKYNKYSLLSTLYPEFFWQAFKFEVLSSYLIASALLEISYDKVAELRAYNFFDAYC